MDKFFIVFNIFVSFIIYSQERKTFDAVRFDSPPIIDGILNDNQWTKSKKLDDFILALPQTDTVKKSLLITNPLLFSVMIIMQFT